ncbi:MAG: hypothetical protein Q8N48_01430, partial [Thiobacillus sp.]|nr:hypothetical protein [Thiobacillus sp.]MDP2977472.1 hypothetical protein [Thiobacillus sp.]
AFIQCPMDVPGCNNDPKTNQSGQTLADANLLKLRVTYGIPENKQIPLAGPFMSGILKFIHENISPDPDPFRVSLFNDGRIPVVVHTVMRMQSPAYENANVSLPGPGNDGKPEDPGPVSGGGELPKCPVTDPACTAEPKPNLDDLPSICDPSDPACASKPPCLNLTPIP